MRILTVGNMYPPHHLGGYELTWRSSVQHLRSSGHDVRVLTTDYRNPDLEGIRADEDADVHRVLRWYWHDHEWPRFSVRERLALERSNAGEMDRHLGEWRPDAVCWWAMGGMSLSLIERVRRAGLPAVGVVGDMWMSYGPDADAWLRLARRLGPAGGLLGRVVGVPASLDLSDVVWLFNSDWTRRRSIEECRFRLDRAELAHPGVDTDLFSPAPEHGWSGNLLYVGRIDPRKGIDTAVEALALLPAETRLTVLGSGDERYMRELHVLCKRLGVADRVLFQMVPREELPQAYEAADALLFPVRWDEPWGLVPLEAMAVGTPVIASGTGGSAEYLHDRENALVVGAGASPSKWAAAVLELAGDPALRATIRDGGLATAPRYTERGYNEAIQAALETVLR